MRANAGLLGRVWARETWEARESWRPQALPGSRAATVQSGGGPGRGGALGKDKGLDPQPGMEGGTAGSGASRKNEGLQALCGHSRVRRSGVDFISGPWGGLRGPQKSACVSEHS